jgi:hypothetical protein
MKRYAYLFIVLITALVGCEKNVSFNMPDVKPLLVVEGHVDVNQPPYVILTRSSAYYGTVDLNSIVNMFVHDATVKVSDGIDTITLTELTFDSAGVPVSVYTDPLFFIDTAQAFYGKPERTYKLWITAGNETVSAVTTIPKAFPLDSIWVLNDVKEDRPDLVRLMARYSDPPELGQFVRYFTKVNTDIEKPGRASVFDDKLVNGTTFDFSLDRGYLQQDSIDFDEYGLFKKGDTITVKWSNIDKPHFDFWRTLEFEINQGGPYSSPVKVQGNINGGLGIWGGYNSSYKTLIVPQ